MRIEARCGSCARRYLLDEVFAGTVLPCPSCGVSDGLRVEAPARPVRARSAGAAAKPRPPAPTRPHPAPAAAVAPAPLARPAPPPANPPAQALGVTEVDEVVCPRCNLHFSPRSTAKFASVTPRRTVLVVEDLAVFRDIASNALTPRFEVKAAADLAAAREHLAAGPVDLIVLDPQLDAGVSGVDLLRDLPPRHCPVVIYTDQDESEIYGESWEALRRLGADDLVVKGLNSGETLARKVCDLLGEQPAEDE